MADTFNDKRESNEREFAIEEELFERWVASVEAINPAGLSDTWIRGTRAGWMAKADSRKSKED